MLLIIQPSHPPKATRDPYYKSASGQEMETWGVVKKATTLFEPAPEISFSEATIVTTAQDKAECRANIEWTTSLQVQHQAIRGSLLICQVSHPPLA